MKINAQMQCKAAGFDLDKCHIERVVEVPKADFFALTHCPIGRHSVIQANQDVMGHDADGFHCLLILGEGQRDGLLVDSEGYDYCRYSSYLPEARAIVEAAPELSITRSVPKNELPQGVAPIINP